MIFLTTFISTIKLYNQIWWNFFFKSYEYIKNNDFPPFSEISRRWISVDFGHGILWNLTPRWWKNQLSSIFVVWKPIFTRLCGGWRAGSVVSWNNASKVKVFEVYPLPVDIQNCQGHRWKPLFLKDNIWTEDGILEYLENFLTRNLIVVEVFHRQTILTQCLLRHSE